MLFLHETHAVMGEQEFPFEDAWHDVYLPKVAEDDGTRLLWYWNSPHGAGEAYKVVTITGARDGAAWERLVERRRYGDLGDWSTDIETRCYARDGHLYVSAGADNARDLDLAAVPTTAADHDTRLFRHDTVTVTGDFDDALGAVETAASSGPTGVLSLSQVFQPQRGPYESPELLVLYTIDDLDGFGGALATTAAGSDWSGSVTGSGALAAMPRQTRILRTSRWSPLS